MAKSETSGCTWIVLVFIIIGAVMLVKAFKDTGNVSPAVKREEMMIYTAEKAVREGLKDSKTAEFEARDTRIYEKEKGLVIVSGSVRASNSFGAFIKSAFAVEMRESGEKWEVLKVDVK
jgi:hypothetical protein